MARQPPVPRDLCPGLLDELHLVLAPVLLGSGEHLLHGIDLRALGYEVAQHTAGGRAVAHVVLKK